MPGLDREAVWMRFMTGLMGYLRTRDITVRKDYPIRGSGAVPPLWKEDGLILTCILDFTAPEEKRPALTVLDNFHLAEDDLRAYRIRQAEDSERAGGRTHFVVRYPDVPAATAVFTPAMGEDIFQRLERRRLLSQAKAPKGRPAQTGKARAGVVPGTPVPVPAADVAEEPA